MLWLLLLFLLTTGGGVRGQFTSISPSDSTCIRDTISISLGVSYFNPAQPQVSYGSHPLRVASYNTLTGIIQVIADSIPLTAGPNLSVLIFQANTGNLLFSSIFPYKIHQRATVSYPQTLYCQDSAGFSDSAIVVNGPVIFNGLWPQLQTSLNPATGQIGLSPPAIGSQTFYWRQAGCPHNNGSINLAIGDPTPSQIGYPATTVCRNNSQNSSMDISFRFPALGTFDALENGLPTNALSIIPDSGTIDIGSSALGQFQIVYSPQDVCSSNDTVDLEISESPSAYFSYPQDTFCAYDANPIPDSISFDSIGIFISGIPGITQLQPAIVDPLTGEIRLQASNLTNSDPYYLQYIAGGFCKDTSTVTVYIKDLSAEFVVDSQYCFNSQGWAQAKQIQEPGYFILSHPTGLIDTIYNNQPFLNEVDLLQLSAADTGLYQVQYNLDTNLVQCVDSFRTNFYVQGVTPPPFYLEEDTACQQLLSVSTLGPTLNPMPTFAGEPGLSITNTGAITPSNTPVGSYQVYMTSVSSSCTATVVLDTIVITEPSNATINYGNNIFCSADTTNPLPSIISPANGVFSSLTLPINSLTGEILLDQYIPLSSTENHDISYLPHPDSCAFPVQLTVQLKTYITGSMSYSDSVFCKGDASSVLPQTNSPFPGIFTAFQYNNPSVIDTNLFLNSLTGEINVDTSLGGIYFVEYDPADQCASSDTVTVSISEYPDPYFEYASNVFCVNDTFPLPDSIATPGGYFFGGLFGSSFFSSAIVDSVTGSIDLPATSNQNAPPYYLHYIVGAGCQTDYTLVIDIKNLSPEFVLDSQVCFNSPGWAIATGISQEGFFKIISPSGQVDTIFNNSAFSPNVNVIQLGNAMPGVYQVGYFLDTSFVMCSDSFWTSIEILGVTHPSVVLDTNVACQQSGLIVINSPPQNIPPSYSGSLNLAITNSGVITPSNTPPGLYTIYMSNQSVNGCLDTIPLDTIRIVEPTNAQLAYGGNVFCTNSTNNPIPSILQPLNGTFISPSLPVDLNTGEIFLDQYTPSFNIESHTILYTPHIDSCAIGVQISVQLRTFLPGTLIYQDSVLCKGGVLNVAPQLVTPTPGQFRAYQALNPSLPDNNLTLDSVTGEINVHSSQIGTYLVEYSPDDQCSSPDTITISIDTFPDPFFKYADTVFCANDTLPIPDSLITPGGTFIGGVPNANIFSAAVVDPITGSIDLQASINANSPPYYLHYIAGYGCQTTHTVKVDIKDLSANFSLPSQSCFNALGWVEASQISQPGYFLVVDPIGGIDTIANPLPISTNLDIIEVNNAIPGVYQVGYFLDTNAVLCTDSFWTSVDILGVAHPPFALDTNVVCKQDGPQVINGPVLNPSPSFSGSNNLSISNSGIITPLSTPAGTYAVFMTTSSGNCTETILLDSIEILEPVNAQIAYGGNVLCNSNPVNPTPSFYQPLNGTFSSPSLPINPTTGEILLDQYVPTNSTETHAILYDPHIDSCGSGTQINVDLRSFSATFNYPEDSVCQAIQFMNYSPSSSFSNGGFNVQFTLAQGAGLNIDPNTGTIRPDLSAAGTYDIIYAINDGVCNDTFLAAHTVTVYPSPDATFNLPPWHCYLDSNISPLNIATPGGIFTANPAGLSINPQSGLINMSTSAPGTYSITYNLSNTGCPVSHQTLFAVRDTLISNFHYLRDTFCSDHGNAIAIEDNGNGGLYQAITTDTIDLDPISGTVDINDSEISMHIIERTADHDCPIPFVDTLWILETNANQFTYGTQTQFCQTAGIIQVDTSSLNGAQGSFTSSSGVDLNTSTGAIDLLNSTEGIYTVFFTPSGGVSCPPQQQWTIEIVAPDSTTIFTYPEEEYCEGGDTISPIVTGDTTGVFYAQGMTFVSGSPGQFLVSSHSPSMYFIQYSLQGVCQEQLSDTVEILPYDDPFFEYAEYAYCQNGPDPQPQNTIATPGGVFSSPSLSSNVLDSITGLIDLSEAPLGLNNIIYLTDSTCPNSRVVTVNILSAPDSLIYDIIPESIFCTGDEVTIKTFTSSDVRLWINTTEITGFADNLYEYISTAFVDKDSITMIQVADGTTCEDTTIVLLTVNPIPQVTILDYTGNLGSGDPAYIQMESSADSTRFNFIGEVNGPVEIGEMIDSTRYDALELAQLDLELTSLSGLHPGTATIFVMPEAKGCNGPMDSVVFNVNPADVKVFIPEAFTPNGDGWNDTWKVQWTEDILPDDFTLRVFNRSQGKVAQDIHPLHPNWDGDNLPDGVYWWTLLDRTGNTIRTGGVTIRRQ